MSRSAKNKRADSNEAWPELIPLSAKPVGPRSYPLDALGSVMGPAAKAVAACTQVPPFLAGQSVLAHAALVTQGLADVEMDDRTYPLSLYVLSIAESGERKSAVDRIVGFPCEQWEQEQLQMYDQNAATGVQPPTQAGLKEARTRSGKKSASKKESRKADARSLPEKPAYPRLFAPEPTLEGIHCHFRNSIPILGLFSDEGGQFFGGHAMLQENALKTISGLSNIWGGSPIRRVRAGRDESYTCHDKRLTLHLMAQRMVVEPILTNELLWQQGVLARFLPAFGANLFGLRTYQAIQPLKDPSIRKLHALLTKRLNDLIQNPNRERRFVRLEPDAKARWIDYYNQVESEIGDSGALKSIRPVAAKAAEQVVRIAGVMSTLENEPLISREHLESSIQLVEYFLEVWSQIRSAAVQQSQLQKAKELLDWILLRDCSLIFSSDLLQNGPRSTGCRKRQALDSLMQALTDHGWVRPEGTNPSGKASSWQIRSIDG